MLLLKPVHLPVLVLIATAATQVSAQPEATCAPVVIAMEKVLGVDHSTTIDIADHKLEAVTAGGVAYVKVRDKWVLSPSTPQKALERERENISKAKVYTCKQLPDEVIDGVPAQVFSARTESAEVASDATVWISKSSGLPLQVENDQYAHRDKHHFSTHYGYSNIQSPIPKE